MFFVLVLLFQFRSHGTNAAPTTAIASVRFPESRATMYQHFPVTNVPPVFALAAPYGIFYELLGEKLCSNMGVCAPECAMT